MIFTRTQDIKAIIHVLCISLALSSSLSQGADGKLIATSGLVSLEGSGGGGLVPWATLTGYDSQEQISVSALATQVEVDDYRLNVLGLSASFYDSVEVSIAKHRFDLRTLGGDISQTIFGLKYKLFGDAVYSDWPQVSLGMQHKRLNDPEIATALGAENSSHGNDFYLAATKVHLGAIGGYNALWNITARATKANELGLLGFAGPENDDYQIMLEGSVGLLLSRHLALGLEYRQKPDNLGLGENAWTDIFISYLPSKNFSLTLAWADLGAIAGAAGQQGLYLSISGQLK